MDRAEAQRRRGSEPPRSENILPQRTRPPILAFPALPSCEILARREVFFQGSIAAKKRKRRKKTGPVLAPFRAFLWLMVWWPGLAAASRAGSFAFNLRRALRTACGSRFVIRQTTNSASFFPEAGHSRRFFLAHAVASLKTRVRYGQASDASRGDDRRHAVSTRKQEALWQRRN
jgi:hypothetical protein